MKTSKKILMALLLLMTLVTGEEAYSACGLSLTANNITVAWDLNFTSLAVSVQVDRSTTDACTYSLGFTRGNATSYTNRRAANGSALLHYQLYQNSGLTNVLKDDTDVSSVSTEVVQGGFQSGPTPISQTVVYYFEIPYNLATTPSLVSSGTFTDSFTINLYETGTLPLGVPVATRTVIVNITVPKMIALSLVDSGGNFQVGQLARNVSIPTLTEGAIASMDLRVRTNAGFSVDFSSLNNGYLKHTNPAKSSLVPYRLFVNGGALNLSSSNTIPVVGLLGVGSTSLSGLGYPLKVVIGNVSGAGVLAGPHSDTVTITATTTE